MSHFPFGSRVYSLDSAFNERAAPRIPEGWNRWHHHPVVPVHRSSAPHYAQASQLYPMRVRSDGASAFRYRPAGGDLETGSSSQAVSIPVVHLSGGVAKRPGYQTSCGVGSASLPRSPFSLPTNRKVASDSTPEAEVDALTSELLRSMETRPHGSETTAVTTLEMATISPAGSIRRVIASSPNSSSSPVLPATLVGRLQQQQQRVGIIGGSSSPITNSNGGRDSPLASVDSAGSQHTSSPSSCATLPQTLLPLGDAASQNTCFRCRRALVPAEGSIIAPLSAAQISNNTVTLTGALAVRLHTACFTCYRCSKALLPNGYYHSHRRLLCPACVRDGAVESCAACHRPISERIVRALGLPYHPGCFVCTVCNCRLDSTPFTVDVHGRPHCIEDFHRRYAPRCTACSHPITPEHASQEARRVVAGDSNYHLHCYGLTSCQQGVATS